MKTSGTCYRRLSKKLSRSEVERKALTEELALVRASSGIMVAGRLRKQTAKLTGRVTPHGGYSMVLMRNTAHVGTIGLVKMCELPVSRWAVQRWERVLATSLFIRDRRRSRGSTLSCDICNIRGDAANSNVGSHSLKAFVGAIDSRCRDVRGHHV